MFGSWIQPYRGCSFGGCVHLGGDPFYSFDRLEHVTCTFAQIIITPAI